MGAVTKGRNVTNGLAVWRVCCTFANRMKKRQNESVKIRVISCCFAVLALAAFKPFGLDAWQWQAYVHLVMMGLLGFVACVLTDGIMKYVVRMPRSDAHGVSYIIRRNLWFQLINTPFVALFVCLYRHFVMSDLVPANRLSWSNFLETLVIFAFCSFAIGLYWRFKFRSRFLAAELEETRLLNQQLQQMQREAEQRAIAASAARTAEPTAQQQPLDDVHSTDIVLTGTTSETVTLRVPDLLYIEAVGNYVKVFHLNEGQVKTDMLRATSKQMEEDLQPYPMIVRCHRAFLVNLQQVEQIVTRAGTMQLFIKHCNDYLPVSRSHTTGIKQAIQGI